MGEKNSGALTLLQITLSRWEAPSSWDRVLQDEPLDPMKSKLVDNFATNVSSTGTITIPLGTAFTSTAANGVFIMTDVKDNLQRAVDEAVFREIDWANDTRGMNGQRDRTSTYGGNLNAPPRELPTGEIPFPRNHKERRIWKSVERRLTALIRKAELHLGARIETASKSEWNDEFWKMVSHRHVDERRRTKK
jgi:hypothetical protein